MNSTISERGGQVKKIILPWWHISGIPDRRYLASPLIRIVFKRQERRQQIYFASWLCWLVAVPLCAVLIQQQGSFFTADMVLQALLLVVILPGLHGMHCEKLVSLDICKMLMESAQIGSEEKEQLASLFSIKSGTITYGDLYRLHDFNR